jgi:hypothetical protein
MPDDASGKEHIKRLGKSPTHAQGCVTKHDGKNPVKRGAQPDCRYRGQAYVETKDDGEKRALYDIDFTLPANARRLPTALEAEEMSGRAPKKRTPRDPRKNKMAWWFEKGDNFIKAYLPYNHNTHHIMPFESLQQLEWEELELVQSSGYNLNGRKNVIILPCTLDIGFALKLPSHPDNHRKYSEAVKKMVNKLKRKLSKKKKDHKLTEKNKGNFKSDLETWQQKQYWALVSYGRTGNRGRRRAVVGNAPLARQVSPRR